MFNDHYKKMCEMYNGLEKSVSEMIEATQPTQRRHKDVVKTS